MTFFVTLVQSLIKVFVIGAVAVGSVQLGRILRGKYDEKKNKEK